ncbi:MAG: inositol monophosphatase family protein [Natrialbaceae archaeon]|nr:inositol monophosphatase family protein [Natrialbaceae archaeon]
MVDDFGDIRRFGSAQIELATVAAGGLEAAVTDVPAYPWDTVAGVAMVRAAGGTVTDLEGEPWKPDARGMVASNGAIHGDLLETLAP